MSRQSGFTVLEALIVVSIGSILMAMAVPSFTELMATQRIRSAATEFHTSLLLARSEAVKRSATVNVVKTGTNWAEGWEVQDNGGTKLAVTPEQSAVTVTASLAAIAFRNSGRITPPQATSPSFLFEANNGKGRDRIVCLDPTGRSYILQASSC